MYIIPICAEKSRRFCKFFATNFAVRFFLRKVPKKKKLFLTKAVQKDYIIYVYYHKKVSELNVL